MKNENRRIVFPSPGWGRATPIALGLVCLALSGLGAAAPSSPPAPNARRPPKVPIPIKIDRYCQRLVENYDANGDGQLDQTEWSRMQGNPRTADLDRDGVITAAELADRIARYGRRRKIRLMPALSGGRVVLPTLLNPTIGPDAAERPKSAADLDNSLGPKPSATGSKAGRGARRQTKFSVPRTRLPRGLPPWFVLRDADGDGQLTMAEFAPKATQSLLEEFARYDRNGDGLATAEECARGPKLPRAEAAMEEESEHEPAKEAFDDTVEATAESEAEEAAPDTGAQDAQSSAAKAAALKRSRKSRSKKLLKPPSKGSGAKSL